MDEIYRDGSTVAMTLGANKKHCLACANILDVRAELCPRCGVPQPPAPGQLTRRSQELARSSKDKTTAGVLALLLGGIGVHRFYLGQIGLGILYMLFCWTFIPSCIAFIEGIVFLTMSEQKFAARYPVSQRP